MGAKQQAYKKLADTMIKNFSKRNIEAFYCDDRNQAVSLAMEMMKDGNTVGFGGSETLNEIGILDTIKNSSLTLIDTNNNGEAVLDWLVLYELGVPTGRYAASGHCMYPEVDFYRSERFMRQKEFCDRHFNFVD